MTTTTFGTVRAAAVAVIEALTPGSVTNGSKKFVCVDATDPTGALVDRMFDIALKEPPEWVAATGVSTPRYRIELELQMFFEATRDNGEDGARICADSTQIQEALVAADLGAPLLAVPGPTSLTVNDVGNYQLSIGFAVLLQ